MINEEVAKVEIKTNCFAYRSESVEGTDLGKHCDALTDLFCKKEVCPFFKPKSENEELIMQ